jgi:XTP/dITP diphosphohydrolase
VKIYFVTVNEFKAKEVPYFLRESGVDLQVVDLPIQEILNIDLSVIIKDKVLKAYREFGRPCVVEHGGLMIDALKGLPGGLSKVVWDTIGDKICNFLGRADSRAATAQSVIGYCDGQRIHIFIGETRGTIAECSRGAYKFQWDPIFIPDGQDKTYAELGFPDKCKYSQAAEAWRQLLSHLRGSR